MDGLWTPTPAPSSITKLDTTAALRLRNDALAVDKLTSWAIGVMEGRSIVGYVDSKGSDGGQKVVYPLFDGEAGVGMGGGGVSDREVGRVRGGVYRLLGLSACFQEVDSGKKGEGDVVFDCTEALTMPLEELFYVCALCTMFSTWSWAKEVMSGTGRVRLVKVLEYRVYDDRKVGDVDESWDLRYSVEYLRRVGLRDRWEGEVREMCEVSRSERRGFEGGYRREMFEERVVGEGKRILVLRGE